MPTIRVGTSGDKPLSIAIQRLPRRGFTSRDGCGWSTGPLLPGTTINQGIGVGS